MVDFNNQYFTYVLNLPTGLEELQKQLATANYAETETFFDESSQASVEVILESEFKDLTIRGRTLRGLARFETVKFSKRLKEKGSLSYDMHEINFFLGRHPKDHLIIMAHAWLARRLIRMLTQIIFKDADREHIHRIRLTTDQFHRFLDSVVYTPNVEWIRSSMDGIHTVAMMGSNTTKPIQRKGLDKVLDDHRAIRISLHDQTNWTVWVNCETGKLSCLNTHDPWEFVQFIQDKILKLGE